MSGSSFGTMFKITTWGESHGKALGVVVDGCPSGLDITEDDIQVWLDRRKPGKSIYETQRKESDKIEILSGVFDGKTTGTPISLIAYNNNERSSDYDHIKNVFRPGHADFTYNQKYSNVDYRGGGRSSGRETLGRVAAGAIAAKILKDLGIAIYAYTKSIADIQICMDRFDINERLNNPLAMPDKISAQTATEFLDAIREEGDSAGGIIECVVDGLCAGIGEPVFDKLDANLSKAIMSIGAVKGIEFGSGFCSSETTGSQNNDCFKVSSGKIVKQTNNSGGVLGGISDGSTLVFRAAIKPTPSISKKQKTIDINGEELELSIKGRHDPIIAPRAVVVVEAMTAITILDLIMINAARKI